MDRDVGRIAVVVASYIAISISLVFLNKVLVSAGSIPAPLFVAWYQCVFTAGLIWALGRVGAMNRKDPYSWFAQFPDQTFDPTVAKAIVPLSLIFVGMITFNQLCLVFVEVSFYNVARSLTICFNVVFTYMILKESTSTKTMVTLLVVIVGFFVGAEGEVNFSLLGTLFGVASSCFVSLNSIFTAKLLKVVHDDKWRLAFYNNVNASCLFVPLIFLSGEDGILYQYQDLLFSVRFWVTMNLAAVLGFLIGIVTVLQIKITSPLTHNMAGTAKACLQSVLAVFIWKNPQTTNAWLGMLLVIFGTLLYTYVRTLEAGAKHGASRTVVQSQSQTQSQSQPQSIPLAIFPNSPGSSKRSIRIGHDDDRDPELGISTTVGESSGGSPTTGPK